MTQATPDATASDVPLASKRKFVAQVSLCSGCCCGNVARGKPEVPIEWIKHEWRTRGLKKMVQLTISGCLGPCDLVNVVRVTGCNEDIWIGNLRELEDYQDLVDWAQQSAAAGTMVPLSARMQPNRFHPFVESQPEMSVS